MLCIYECPQYAPGPPEVLGGLRLHGIRHFGLRIEDEGEWRALVEREGIPAEETRWERSTSWYVNDPTGYEIEVAHWKDGRIEFGPDPKESP